MYHFLYFAVILLLRAGFAVSQNTTEEYNNYTRSCPDSICAGIEVKLPFRLDSSPSNCSAPGTQLTCSNNNTTLSLNLPGIGLVTVTKISSINNYDNVYPLLTIKFADSWASCPLQNLISTNFSTSLYTPYPSTTLALLNCSKTVDLDADTNIAGPFPCLGDERSFVYVADSSELMEKVPTECEMKEIGVSSDFSYDETAGSWAKAVNDFNESREMVLTFQSTELQAISSICKPCDDDGNHCIFSHKENQAVCLNLRPPGSHKDIMAIIGGCVGGVLLIIVIVSIMVYFLLKSDREKEVRKRVEKFLETYSGHKPTRYTFKEVKKITKRFKNKLGQGGYGTVYKGELPNGIPVAVKMLENSKGKGEEFINEVATIGRIHHVNIVRLLGFCSEGSRRALVYEFMPKDSLDKYIFSREANQGRSTFDMQTLLDIAIGIARGIEYLHQGCNQRILHFDIKPHNILLDYDFKPKIADFGLAKLCSREKSIVTMTAARGTMGYIAPELYSRNFGTVSYKSDVYSFGMLLLEMIGGRKNLDPDITNQSQIYFPEWVYDHVVNKQELRIVADMQENEEEIARKLALVALWCIQWSPMERPTMTRVLQMLIEGSQHLEIPPKPFVSGDEHNNAT